MWPPAAATIFSSLALNLEQALVTSVGDTMAQYLLMSDFRLSRLLWWTLQMSLSNFP